MLTVCPASSGSGHAAVVQGCELLQFQQVFTDVRRRRLMLSARLRSVGAQRTPRMTNSRLEPPPGAPPGPLMVQYVAAVLQGALRLLPAFSRLVADLPREVLGLQPARGLHYIQRRPACWIHLDHQRYLRPWRTSAA